MKKLTLFACISLIFNALSAQTLNVSEEMSIASSDGYGIIGKLNDRILFFNLENSKVKVRALDTKLHRLWDKEIEPDRKNSAKVIEVIGSKQDFNVIYQFRRKGHTFIKIHKYDGQLKLLDSVMVKDWGKDFTSPTLQIVFSEDKKTMLLYELEGSDKIIALVVSMDSLRPIWDKKIEIKDWDYDNPFHQILVNNKAEAFFIKEEDNRNSDLGKHRFKIKKYSESEGEQNFEIKMADTLNMSVKFSYDNANQHLTAAGLYAPKSTYKAKGYYFIRAVPPQYEAAKITFQPFDDEFVTAMQGKKVTDNKGMIDLRVQEIVHRRDGGILAIFEQVREVERQMTVMNNRMSARGDGLRLSIDYYYDNIFAISMAADGVTHWKSIFYKKQLSQDDDARYCSYFLAKTPSSLRVLFNDDVERSTTVSEYVLDAKGQTEHHTIYNTDGHDVNLRFKDALQISSKEINIPSDDRRRLKLVKVQY